MSAAIVLDEEQATTAVVTVEDVPEQAEAILKLTREVSYEMQRRL